MSILISYMVAEPTALKSACSGWVEPLPTPRTVHGMNPITREIHEFPSWIPADADLESANPRPNFDVLSPVDGGDVDVVVLAQLASLLDGKSHEYALELTAKPALIGPPESDLLISALPSRFVSHLAALESDQVPMLAARWAQAQRHDVESISDPGTRETILTRHDQVDWNGMLALLVALSQQAVRDNKLIYCVQWP